jgi:Tol biopolymer transport system component
MIKRPANPEALVREWGTWAGNLCKRCWNCCGVALTVLLVLNPSAPPAAGPVVVSDDAVPASAQKLYSDQLPDWIFAVPTELQVCDNEKFAAFGRGYWYRTIDLSKRTGNTIAAPQSDATHVIFAPSCAALRGDGHAWTAMGAGGAAQALAKALPQNIIARFSRDGHLGAWFTAGRYYVARPEGRTLHISELGRTREFDLGQPIIGAEWTPDGKTVIALLHDPETGLSKLMGLTIEDGKSFTLAEHLDGSGVPNSIGVSRDGRKVYLSLVGTEPPSVTERNDPFAKRDLDIFAFDLEHHTFTRVIATPFDDFGPTVVGDTLYWTTGDSHNDAVVLPYAGGRAHLVADGGQMPYWSPDDRSLAYFVGDERMADPAINYDDYITDLDAEKKSAGPSRPLITGSHEDFTPEWSPNGKWMSFHSHRCPDLPPFYFHKGCTDGIWLLKVGDPVSKQRLISPPGTWEVGPGDWSPDGRHIVFSSWNRNGPLDIAELRIITLDPDTGQILGQENLGIPKPMVNPRLQYWSPKSNEIAVEDIKDDENHSIIVFDYGTRKSRKVLDFRSSTFGALAWSADGRRIIYSALVGGRQQLFDIPKEGGAPRQISDEQFGDLIFPTVSHDGKWIAANRMMTTRELWSVPVAELHDLSRVGNGHPLGLGLP